MKRLLSALICGAGDTTLCGDLGRSLSSVRAKLWSTGTRACCRGLWPTTSRVRIGRRHVVAELGPRYRPHPGGLVMFMPVVSDLLLDPSGHLGLRDHVVLAVRERLSSAAMCWRVRFE